MSSLQKILRENNIFTYDTVSDSFGENLILTQKEINAIRITIASLDGHNLPELVSELEVFEYVEASRSYESQRALWSDKFGEDHFDTERFNITPQEVAEDLIGYSDYCFEIPQADRRFYRNNIF